MGKKKGISSEIKRTKVKLPDYLDEKTRKAINDRLARYEAARTGDVDAIISILREAGWRDEA